MAIGYSSGSGALHSQVRLAASTLLTRLPVSMMPLSLLLLVVDRTDSFAWAGLTAGAHVAGHAFAAPAITRRYSQIGFFRPMLACSVAYPLLASLVIALAYSETAWWLVPPLAVVMGAALPVTRYVLAGAWHRLAQELDGLRDTSSSIDSGAASAPLGEAPGGPTPAKFGVRVMNTVVSDAGALLGPLLVAVVIAGDSAGYAVGVAALAALVGSWLLISDPHAAAVRVADPQQDASAITRVPSAESRSHQLAALLVSGAAALVGFGALTAAVTGFARDEMGHPALAGVLLALWAAGGFIGGVWYGSIAQGTDERLRYRWTLVLVILAHLPLIFVNRTIVLVVLLPLAGALAAANTAAYTAVVGALARRVGVPGIRARVAKAGYFGFAIGLAIGGISVGEFSDAWPAFAVCVVALVVALLSGTLGPTVTKRLRERNSRPTGAHSRRGGRM